jgi:poly-gamma-glutamate synthesis protein (capsule biosynthesis protein)
MAVGDLMWIRSGWDRSLSAGIRKKLLAADAVFANLETPIHTGRKVPKWTYESFHYNAPPEYLAPWSPQNEMDSRRNFFSLCNNHALDQGEEGLIESRKSVLSFPGNVCIGGHSAGEELSHTSIRNWELSVFGTTYGVNHLRPGVPPPAGIPVIQFGNPSRPPDWEQIAFYIGQCRTNGAQLVVLMAHWSHEYEYWPDAGVREDAHRLIAMGVDVIIGGSPHVIQPLEVVSVNGWDSQCPTQLRDELRRDARFGIIAYSLGNLATIMPTAHCQLGAVLEIEVDRSPEGRIEIRSISLTPTFSRRGMGEFWLDAQARLLGESSLCQALSRSLWKHARQIFGSSIAQALENSK